MKRSALFILPLLLVACDDADVASSADGSAPSPDAGGITAEAGVEPAPVDGRAPSDPNLCTVYDAPRPLHDAGTAPAPSHDAATPPTHCIAPCVWELMRDCLPSGPCVRQRYPRSFDLSTTGSVACAPDADWWAVTTSRSFHVYLSTTDYFRGDRRCYGFATGCPTCGFGGHVTTQTYWFTADGKYAALQDGDTRAPVMCPLSGPVDDLIHPGTLSVDYPQDPDDPACAAWLEPTCENGCCGAPPAVPLTSSL